MLPALAPPAEGEEQQAEDVVRLLEVGRTREQLAQPGYGSIGAFDIRQAVRQVGHHVGVGHAAANSAAQHRKGALGSGIQPVRHGQAELRLDGRRLQRVRTLVLGERLVEPALLPQQLRQVVMRLGVGGPDLQRTPEGVFRGLDFLIFAVRDAETVEIVGVPPVQLHRATRALDRDVGQARAHRDHRQRMPRLMRGAVALDNGEEQALGSAEITGFQRVHARSKYRRHRPLE